MADHWHLTCTKSEGDKASVRTECIVRDGYEDREIGIARGLGYVVNSRSCSDTTHLGPEPYSRSLSDEIR